MRKFPTEAEEKLWQALRGNKLNGLYFRRQRPVGPFIVDFYCEALKLAVEVDGDFHQEGDIRVADQEREEYLRRRGIHTLRCTNEDVLYRMNSVLHLINNRASLPRLTEGERSEPEVPGEGSRVGARAEGNGMGEAGESRVGARTDIILTIEIPDSLLPFVVPNGSITLDGVALTVASITGMSPRASSGPLFPISKIGEPDHCLRRLIHNIQAPRRAEAPQGEGGFEKNNVTIAIIPRTLACTTLGSLKKNDAVNIETDILGRYVLHAHGKK